PEDFGFKTQPPEASRGKSPLEYARSLLEVLYGRQGFHRNVVCMNAAAAIRAAARTKAGGSKNLSLKEAAVLAQKSIDSKAALGKFEKLKEMLSSSEESRDPTTSLGPKGAEI